MKHVTTYLNFNGNCRAAMEFYKKCLGGQLEIMPYSQMPDEHEIPAEAKNLVMHSCLSKEGSAPMLMASDAPPGMPFHLGNNFYVSVHCESQEEIERHFAALGENGKVQMPLQDTFWGAHFGMLTDQFGVQWMFNFEKSGKAK